MPKNKIDEATRDRLLDAVAVIDKHLPTLKAEMLRAAGEDQQKIDRINLTISIAEDVFPSFKNDVIADRFISQETAEQALELAENCLLAKHIHEKRQLQ